jgi:hypothetical protein
MVAELDEPGDELPRLILVGERFAELDSLRAHDFARRGRQGVKRGLCFGNACIESHEKRSDRRNQIGTAIVKA